MEREKLKRKIVEVLKPYRFIDFALLFGSEATGKTHPMSDVDIAISSQRALDLLLLGGIVAELESAVERPVDLLLLNDLPGKNPKLAFSVLSHHEILLIRNEERYFTFKEETYRYYFDQAPMLRSFDEAFLKRTTHGTLR